MAKNEPFVVYEGQCEEETSDAHTNPDVRWWTLVSGDRKPSTALTVGIAEVDPGEPPEMRLHHHSPPEVYYILSGEGIVHIDGKDHPVGPGATVFIPGDAWHAARNTGNEPLRLLYVFGVDSFDEVEYHYGDSGEAPR